MTSLVGILKEKHKAWVDKAFPGYYSYWCRDAGKNIESNVAQWLRVASAIQKVDIEYCTEGYASDEGESKAVLRFTSTSGETVRLMFHNGELDDIVPY